MPPIMINRIESPDSAGALYRDGPMTLLSDAELERIAGGDRQAQCDAWKIICIVAGVGSFAGLMGTLLFGPTNLMCLLDQAIDYSHCD